MNTFFIDGHLGFQRDPLSLDSPMGTRIERDTSGRARREIRLYNAYASAIPVGHPCLIRYDGDEETNPFVVSGAAASGTAVIELFCTPQKAVPATSWGWFTIAGYCQALVEGTTDVAKDDFLKLVIATTSGIIKDTATQPGTANTCAIALAAQTANSAVLTDVFIIPRLHAVAQS